MSLVDHLIKSRTTMELAKELAERTKEVITLKDEIAKLKYELFWKTESSNRFKEMQEISRYRWIRDGENSNVIHCIIGQGQYGEKFDHIIDLTRSLSRNKCTACKGSGIHLSEDSESGSSCPVWCPSCDGTGKRKGNGNGK